MKKFILTIIIYLLSLVLFVVFGSYVTSLEWFPDPTELQAEIFCTGVISVFVFNFLCIATVDLVGLLPWDKICRKIFKRKSPTPADLEETERPEP